MPREKKPDHVRSMERLSDLNRRYNALPIWLIEAQSDAFIQWVDDISSTTEAIQATGSVAPEALENVSMWEHAMNHWERTAAREAGEKESIMEKTSEIESAVLDAGLWEQRIAEVNQAIHENKIERKALLARKRKLERALEVAREDLKKYPARDE
jgi:chromosome segregation ATPase